MCFLFIFEPFFPNLSCSGHRQAKLQRQAVHRARDGQAFASVHKACHSPQIKVPTYLPTHTAVVGHQTWTVGLRPRLNSIAHLQAHRSAAKLAVSPRSPAAEHTERSPLQSPRNEATEMRVTRSSTISAVQRARAAVTMRKSKPDATAPPAKPSRPSASQVESLLTSPEPGTRRQTVGGRRVLGQRR